MAGNQEEPTHSKDGGTTDSGGASKRAISDVPNETLPEGAYRLLVPIPEDLASEEAEQLLETAATVARGRDAGLLIASLATVARQTPLSGLSADEEVLTEARASTEQVLAIAAELDVPAAGVVRLTHQESSAILDLVDDHDCDGIFMLIDPESSQRQRLLSGDTVETVVSRAECEVFVVKQPRGPTPLNSLLLTVSGGPHSGLAAEIARAIALQAEADVHVVHFINTDPTEADREEAQTILQAAERVLEDVPCLTAETIETGDIAEEIISRSNEHDLTVLGAPTTGLLQQFIFGTVPDTVNQQSPNEVVMAQDDIGGTSLLDRWISGDPTE